MWRKGIVWALAGLGAAGVAGSISRAAPDAQRESVPDGQVWIPLAQIPELAKAGNRGWRPASRSTRPDRGRDQVVAGGRRGSFFFQKSGIDVGASPPGSVLRDVRRKVRSQPVDGLPVLTAS